MADQIITNQCAHIRELIRNSETPMSYAQIVAACPGMPLAGFGSSLNKMVKKGHLIRTGERKNYRYTYGQFDAKYLKCASEEERQERYRARRKRRQDKVRLLTGGKTREQRSAEKAARLALKAAARAEREQKALERKAAEAARIKARIELLALREAKRDEQKKQKEARLAARQAPKPKRSKPAHQQLVIPPDSGFRKTDPNSRQAQTVDDFVINGGVIQKLPGLKKSDTVAPRRPVVQFRGVQAI